MQTSAHLGCKGKQASVLTNTVKVFMLIYWCQVSLFTVRLCVCVCVCEWVYARVCSRVCECVCVCVCVYISSMKFINDWSDLSVVLCCSFRSMRVNENRGQENRRWTGGTRTGSLRIPWVLMMRHFKDDVRHVASSTSSGCPRSPSNRPPSHELCRPGTWWAENQLFMSKMERLTKDWRKLALLQEP